MAIPFLKPSNPSEEYVGMSLAGVKCLLSLQWSWIVHSRTHSFSAFLNPYTFHVGSFHSTSIVSQAAVSSLWGACGRYFIYLQPPISGSHSVSHGMHPVGVTGSLEGLEGTQRQITSTWKIATQLNLINIYYTLTLIIYMPGLYLKVYPLSTLCRPILKANYRCLKEWKLITLRVKWVRRLKLHICTLKNCIMKIKISQLYSSTVIMESILHYLIRNSTELLLTEGNETGSCKQNSSIGTIIWKISSI